LPLISYDVKILSENCKFHKNIYSTLYSPVKVDRIIDTFLAITDKFKYFFKISKMTNYKSENVAGFRKLQKSGFNRLLFLNFL
jgi:hypothetical protein